MNDIVFIKLSNQACMEDAQGLKDVLSDQRVVFLPPGFDLAQPSEMNQLIEQTKQWFLDKGLTGPDGKGTLAAQAKKNLEEAGEIILEVGIWQRTDSVAQELKVKNEIGDNFVTLIGICEMLETTPEECLQLAYDKISKRTGTVVNSQFVRDRIEDDDFNEPLGQACQLGDETCESCQ